MEANLIKEARIKAGLTREQLAEHYNIPIRTLQSWESGDRKPLEYVSNALLRCIAVDFNVPILLTEKTLADEELQEDISISDFEFSHLDGSPLMTNEIKFVYQERKKGTVTSLGTSPDRFYLIHKCSNGFTFRVRNK